MIQTYVLRNLAIFCLLEQVRSHSIENGTQTSLDAYPVDRLLESVCRRLPANSVSVETKNVTLDRNGTTLTAFMAYPVVRDHHKLAAVFIAHDWNGRDEYENDRAIQLAQLGYAAFAMDIYGAVGRSRRDNRRLIAPFMRNRTYLLESLRQQYERLNEESLVDQQRVAAIGYCFGGTAVLDMARAGWPLKGVVSFHGGLSKPDGLSESAQIKAKVLVSHGYADTSIRPAAVLAFEEEMESRGADWQVHVYGNKTNHAFTVPTSARYQPSADRRSWQAMVNFLREIFY